MINSLTYSTQTGIPGSTTVLHVAMMLSSSEILALILDHGADIYATNVLGHDPFQNAATFGRFENLKFWIEKHPHWNIDRTSRMYGGTALSMAVFMGYCNFDVIKFLLHKGANFSRKTNTGSPLLLTASSNEDADLEMIHLLLKVMCGNEPSERSRLILNEKLQPVSLRWKVTYMASKMLIRTGMSNAGLYRILADEPGSTALSYAVIRGDEELTRLLLKFGADPMIRNDMGLNAMDLCEKYGPYPSVRKVLLMGSGW